MSTASCSATGVAPKQRPAWPRTSQAPSRDDSPSRCSCRARRRDASRGPSRSPGEVVVDRGEEEARPGAIERGLQCPEYETGDAQPLEAWQHGLEQPRRMEAGWDEEPVPDAEGECGRREARNALGDDFPVQHGATLP